LCLHGLPQSLNCVNRMMDLYQWETWPDFFLVKFIEISPNAMTLVIENNEFRLFSSPVKHLVPTIGLRIESLKTGRVIAYSCDTEPCLQVEQLAKNADILLHEATGKILGHSSAEQAAEVAEKSGVKSLYLIHYHPHLYQSQELILEASKKFSGEIKFARDLMEFEL
jgi:ribonuclease Z